VADWSPVRESQAAGSEEGTSGDREFDSHLLVPSPSIERRSRAWQEALFQLIFPTSTQRRRTMHDTKWLITLDLDVPNTDVDEQAITDQMIPAIRDSLKDFIAEEDTFTGTTCEFDVKPLVRA
jgi:hypothetical protein